MYKQSSLFNGIDPQPREIHKAPIDPIGYGKNAQIKTSGMVLASNNANWQDSKQRHYSFYAGKRYITGNTVRPAFTPTNFIGIKQIQDREVPDMSKRITCGLDSLMTSKQKLSNEQLIKHPPNPYRFSN
jgi:hypothetical protein